MQTYQKRKSNLSISKDRPAAPQTHNTMSNQLALKAMGSDGNKTSSDILLETLRSRFEESSNIGGKAIETLQNVNLEKGNKVTLEDGLRSRLESMTGYNLSNIRIRESQQAADIGARAFTKGNVIQFAPGQYRPDTERGKQLIAHEVTHVIQQARGGIKADSGWLNVNTDLALENSADRMGTQLTSAEASYSPVQGLTPLPAVNAAIAPVQGGWFTGIGKKLKDFASSAISGIASGAKSAWNYAKKIPGRIQRSHQRSVDELNNSREDYDKAPLLKRIKWSLLNPLARIHAGFDKDGTAKRNARKQELDEMAGAMASERDPSKKFTLSDEEEAYLTGDQARRANIPIDSNSGTSTMGKISNTLGGGMLAASNKVKTENEASGDYSELAKSTKEIGITGSVLGALGSGIGAIKSGSRAINQFKDGNYAGSAASALDTVSNTGSIGGSIAKTALESAVPGFGIVTGGAQAASGVIKLGSAQSSRNALGERLKAFAPKDGNGIDRDKIYDPNMTEEEKTLRMLHSNTNISRTGAVFDIVSGSMKAAGALPGAGTALGFAGTAGDMIKSGVTSHMRSNLRKDAMNREIDLDNKITELMKNNKSLSEHEAKYIILRSYGVESGTRDEAYSLKAAKTAIRLHQNASKKDEEGEKTRGILKDSGLYNTGRNLSIQGIAEKLGIEEGADLQSKVIKSKKKKHSWD